MSAEGTQTLLEGRLRGALPEGFKTTLAESNRLRQLNEYDPQTILSDVVEDYGDHTLAERDVVLTQVQTALASFLTPERTLELPGTGMEIENGNLLKFAAAYKEDTDTPSGTIHDVKRAGTDDIVFTFASPEVYQEVTGNAQDTFRVDGVTGGSSVNVVGDAGLHEAGNADNASISLDDDEWMYFTGDYIDLNSGKSVLTKVQWEDLDGESYGADDGVMEARLNEGHLLVAQGGWVKSTADLDMKAYEDGDAELVPVAFYMGPGNKAPALV